VINIRLTVANGLEVAAVVYDGNQYAVSVPTGALRILALRLKQDGVPDVPWRVSGGPVRCSGKNLHRLCSMTADDEQPLQVLREPSDGGPRKRFIDFTRQKA
jgi:hypothetical protein